MNVFDYFFESSRSLAKEAILNPNDAVAYSELYENSLKIASEVYSSIGEGNHVVLIGHNSSFFVAVYLGIIKSGNICVPLNFNIEQDNLDHIIDLTGSPLVFASKQVLKKLDFGSDARVIDQDAYQEILAGSAQVSFSKEFDENRMAEIIFTSGSTGKPKGVMISHKNIRANTESIISYLDLSADDIVCNVLPFYYCYGLSVLHTHLRVGASIVLNNTFMFLGTVIKDLLQHNCTGFSGVPSHFQMLLKKSDTFKSTHFPALRYVTQAGGKLPNTFIKDFVSAFPSVDFFVMYGQTEATARLSYLDPKKLNSKLGSIGRAIPGVCLKIVDQSGSEVEPGQEGELIASGDNIMRGYYKDSELSNTILRNNWLYTGDIAKKDQDGDIFIVARKKEIIKVGGNRVSPKEIEEIISSVAQVIDCTVKGIHDDLQGEAIKAFVTINNSDQEEEIKQQILAHCKTKLALYKIPQFFEFTQEMNLKATGKKKP